MKRFGGASLSAGDLALQAAVLEAQPTRLGNLDGLPVRVRDAANRASIETYRAELEKVREALGPGVSVSGASTTWELIGGDTTLGQVKDKLKALSEVERILAGGDYQLLVLDPFSGHRLHAAVGVGDLDTADNVTVFRPGFTSNVQNSLKDYVRDMKSLRATAQHTAFKHDAGYPQVAAIAWLGYDAPQLDEATDQPRSVALPVLAKQGCTFLAGFLTGIDATRHEKPPHVTAIAHSYGSVATGYALQDSGVHVDDAALLGSPGAGASHRSALHVPVGHLYVDEADLDPVADAMGGIAPFGGDPSHLSGVTFLENHAVHTPLGNRKGITGHTSYLDDKTTSQYNLAMLAAGMRDDLITTHAPPLIVAGRPTGDALSLASKTVKAGVSGAGHLAEDAVTGVARSLTDLANPCVWMR